MKKLLASLLFALPALSMSLYGATLESPKGASHHRHHHHHDCSSSSSSSEDSPINDTQFAFFYLDEDQFLNDDESVIWNVDNGTHTAGIFIDPTGDLTNIIIAERGIYLVTWVLTLGTDPAVGDNGAVQFQLELNGQDIAGGVYATTIEEPDSGSFKAGQLFGQTVVTVLNTFSSLSLANDSDKTVELVADLLTNENVEASPDAFNVSASIFIQKLTDFSVR